MTKSLDLGSGPVPKNPFGADEVYGVDIYDTGNENVKIADLVVDAIPFEDNTFDYVVGTDFLEHIPRVVYLPGKDGPVRKSPFIDVMSEVWRVLKPGGVTQFKTPACPQLEAFQDPTHVNFITPNTIDYFVESPGGLMTAYGFKGHFEKAYDQRWEGFWLVWELRAIK